MALYHHPFQPDKPRGHPYRFQALGVREAWLLHGLEHSRRLSLQGGRGLDALIGWQSADTCIGGAQTDFCLCSQEGFENGVHDIINYLNFGGTPDWFTTSGVHHSTILAPGHLGGVFVTVASGTNGGGACIENFTIGGILVPIAVVVEAPIPPRYPALEAPPPAPAPAPHRPPPRCRTARRAPGIPAGGSAGPPPPHARRSARPGVGPGQK